MKVIRLQNLGSATLYRAKKHFDKIIEKYIFRLFSNVMPTQQLFIFILYERSNGKGALEVKNKYILCL
jgi:hypothetical protein